MIFQRNNGIIFHNNISIGIALEMYKIPQKPTIHNVNGSNILSYDETLVKFKIKRMEFDLNKKETEDLFGGAIPTNMFQQKKSFEVTTHEGSCFDTVAILRDCWVTNFSKSYTKDNKFYVEDLELATAKVH